VTSAGKPRVWCNAEVLSDLGTLARDKEPLETGGCFAGHYVDDSEDVVITNVIGPGPRAIHMRTRFVADRKFHDDALEELWQRSNRTIRYVGDWHSHPDGAPGLSSVDKAFMKHALRSRHSYLRYSLVAIVYGDLSQAHFWCLERSRRRFGFLSGVRTLEVVQY